MNLLLSDPAFLSAAAAVSGGGANWTPAQITTGLWLDAADAGTLTLESGAVSQWNDKSGNSRHVVQSNSARQPLFQAAGFNGLPAVDFDGSNDFLKNATYQPSGALTCALVFNRDTNSGVFVNVQRSGGIFEVAGSFGGGYRNITFTGTGPGNGIGTGIGFDMSSGGTAQNAIMVIQYDGAGTLATDYVARLNGVAQSLSSSGLLGYQSETGLCIGGRAVQDLAFFNGLISEVVLREGVTNLSDSQKIEGYLAHKWGLTANLPADHPYKSVAPTV